MLRMVILLAAAVAVVLVVFPDEVAVAVSYARQMLHAVGVGSTGAYGAMAR
jgi:hypothetical protein